MKDIEKLREEKILDKQDIISIRNYIKNTRKNIDEKHSMSIFSDSVYRIVDNNLDGISEKYRESIKVQLVKDMIINNKEGLVKYDVIDKMLSMDNKEDNYIETLTNWINKNLDNKITSNELKNYIFQQNSIKETKMENQNNKSKDIEPILENNSLNKKFIVTSILSLLLIIFITKSNFPLKKDIDQSNITSVTLSTLKVVVQNTHKDIPDFFMYKDIDKNKLKEYLNSRDSILTDEPYFSTIIETSKKYNLNPIILFSITGQEQGFVPRDNKYGKEIANNPFNVFGSWIKYNTNIKDSSEIAAKTITNSLKERPLFMDPFIWINRRYAEDDKWWIGVSKIYSHIENIISD